MALEELPHRRYQARLLPPMLLALPPLFHLDLRLLRGLPTRAIRTVLAAGGLRKGFRTVHYMEPTLRSDTE